MTKNQLSHLDPAGKAQMVDVGDKKITDRIAVARGEVEVSPATYELIKDGALKKGDVLTVAQIAGISAAKRTSELIPLCHPLQLNSIRVDIELEPELPGLIIEAEIRSSGKTGVEMEALTAVAVAALTVYDMAKAVQKDIKIGNIRLIEKRGGKSGDYQAQQEG
ncbi:MAG: cyclic pyranopterin monophosphate synthase MoaC [Anaerolineales bacterium]